MGCAFLAVFISLYFVSSHLPPSTQVALTVALVACSGPISLANATPVHVHEPASGWRLGFPAANADAATSRHTRIARLRIFIVLSLSFGLLLLRPSGAGGLVGYARSTAMSTTSARGSLRSSCGASLILVERLPPPTITYSRSITRPSM